MIIQPNERVLAQKDIQLKFGLPEKTGRHINLGLREEYSNDAIVDYELNDLEVKEIKFGYIGNSM